MNVEIMDALTAFIVALLGYGVVFIRTELPGMVKNLHETRSMVEGSSGALDDVNTEINAINATVSQLTDTVNRLGKDIDNIKSSLSPAGEPPRRLMMDDTAPVEGPTMFNGGEE